MEKLRKHLSFILILTLILTLCPTDFMGTISMKHVLAAENVIASGSCGSNVKWAITEDTEIEWDLADTTPYKLTITGTGAMYDYNFYTAVPWNSYRETITKISVGEGITHIGNYNFCFCSSLVSVELPESLVSIGNYGFYASYLLETIAIPDNVTSIGDFAFYQANTLESVTMGKNVETIGSYAFYDSEILQEVVFNEKLVSIGEWAFAETALTTVNIPASVSAIGSVAFGRIYNLSSITVSESSSTYKIIDSMLYEMKNGMPYTLLASPYALRPTKVNVADGTEIIDKYVFYQVSSMKSVIFPNTLKEIREGAFYYCTGLTALDLPDSVEIVGKESFRITKIKTLYLGKNLHTISDGAFTACTVLETVTCSEENEHFKVIDNALYSKDGTKFYLYPAGRQDEVFHVKEGVTYIGYEAFFNAQALQELYLTNSLQELSRYAISQNKNLKSIYFYGDAPSGESGYDLLYSNYASLLLYIAEGATGFDSEKWTKFTYAKWDPMENFVDEGTFGDVAWTFEGSMGRLTLEGNGNVPDSNENIPAPWSNYMDSVQTIEAEGITGLGDYAFYKATNLLRVETDEQIAFVGDYTFGECNNLKFIVIESIDSLGTAAFQNCFAITEITLGPGMTALEENVFAGCAGLVNLVIPNAVTSIKSGALKGCSSLRTINIPEGVTTIGSEALSGNTALEKVYFYGSVPSEWAEDSFADCGNNLILYYRTVQSDWNNLNGSWNFIPVVGQDKFYTEQEDHYSFDNSYASFGYGEGYRIPRQRYVDALRGIIEGTYYYSVNRKWTGSCYGMASSTLEFYENSNFDIADYDAAAKNLYDISAPGNPLAPLTKLIEVYQVSQHDLTVRMELYSNMRNYKKLIQRIEEFERSGGLAVDSQATPVVMAVYSMFGGHALVPVSVEQNEAGDYEIQVYDCNYPTQFHTVTITKDYKNLSYGWYSYGSYIDYTTIAGIMDGAELHLAAEDNSVYLSVDKENVKLTNGVGQGIDEIEGAYEEKFFNNNEEDTFTGIRSFVLPDGNYTFSADAETTEEEDSVTFYMASENVFAEVVSTNEEAVLEVQKDDTENGEVLLALSEASEEGEGGENTEETASITLINSAGMERTIELTGSSAEISIAEDNETITIAVPTEETVKVDGKEVADTDGATELTFVTSQEENPLKVKDLTTEISCNETNTLSGNVTFSLVSNSSETQNAVVVVDYLDETDRIVASYNENVEAESGTDTVTIDFLNLQTDFAYGEVWEDLTCRVTVALLDESGVSSGDALARSKAECSITRYARITFDTNGGTGSYDTQYVACNSTVSEPETAPVKDGFVFGGWFTDGEESAYDFRTAVTGDMTLMAKWIVRTSEPTPSPTPSPTPPQTSEKKIKVKQVKIVEKNVKIAAGKKVKLTTTVTPSNATNKKLTWKSSNTKYATVKNGTVTTKKAGKGKTVTITATAKDGSGKKTTVKIKIMKNAVKKITLKAASTSVKAGKKVKITSTVTTTGKNSVNKTLAWSSSNTKYATVKKGVVTTKKAGKGKKVTITAKSTDGTNKKAKVTIKIK